MVDANQFWDLPAARRAARELAAYDIFWLEEPLPAEDFRGYADLRRLIGIPVAAGESLYTEAQFRELLLAGGIDFIQPNVCRVGGITPFLRIARLARQFSVPVMPHLLPDISGSSRWRCRWSPSSRTSTKDRSPPSGRWPSPAASR